MEARIFAGDAESAGLVFDEAKLMAAFERDIVPFVELYERPMLKRAVAKHTTLDPLPRPRARSRSSSTSPSGRAARASRDALRAALGRAILRAAPPARRRRLAVQAALRSAATAINDGLGAPETSSCHARRARQCFAVRAPSLSSTQPPRTVPAPLRRRSTVMTEQGSCAPEHAHALALFAIVDPGRDPALVRAAAQTRRAGKGERRRSGDCHARAARSSSGSWWAPIPCSTAMESANLRTKTRRQSSTASCPAEIAPSVGS